jgi:ATP-dependent exoDNAse (exonuclease V) alpha subunit
VDVAEEFRVGDRVRFARNNYRADPLNGQTATVMAVDPQGASLCVEQEDGNRQMLDLRHLADCHVRPEWVRTIHSAQGATAKRVIAHLESFRANIVDAGAAYVAISRARSHAAIYTDSRANLVAAITGRDGSQVGAIDETMTRDTGLSLGE